MSNNNSFHIGRRIKELREKAGMTQEDLAKIIGYKSRSTINKIEMGKNDIPQSKIELFAKALKVPPIVLMGWDMPDLSDSESDLFSVISFRQNSAQNPLINELQKEIIKMNKEKLQDLLKYAKYLNK